MQEEWKKSNACFFFGRKFSFHLYFLHLMKMSLSCMVLLNFNDLLRRKNEDEKVFVALRGGLFLLYPTYRKFFRTFIVY